MTDRELFFENVYMNNWWQGKESRSGTGSEGAFAEEKINLLRNIIARYDVMSILDIGCGDMNWMKTVLTNTHLEYTGIDVSDSVVRDNQMKCPHHCFEKLDLTKTYKVDLVIVFDVFGHQLHHEVVEMVNFINKLDAKYVCVTNRINAETLCPIKNKTRHQGINIEHYDWRRPKIQQHPALYPDDYFCLYGN